MIDYRHALSKLLAKGHFKYETTCIKMDTWQHMYVTVMTS